MKLYEILMDLWTLLVGNTPPDYIIKAFNWLSLLLLLLIFLSPFLVLFLVARMLRGSRYE